MLNALFEILARSFYEFYQHEPKAKINSDKTWKQSGKWINKETKNNSTMNISLPSQKKTALELAFEPRGTHSLFFQMNSFTSTMNLLRFRTDVFLANTFYTM